MADSTNLKLPYIAAAQAQKHVTHNEAIRALDALVQLSVKDRDLATPPGAPVDGDRYIVAASPSGAWAGQVGKIAAWQDGAWLFYAPVVGWLAWVDDETAVLAWDGTDWVNPTAGSAPSTLPILGINATADLTNRLVVAAEASLFNHAGAGHQIKLNKAAAGDTASILYQDGFSGRAEIGLAGDDDFHFKVSPDGSSWNDAIIIDKSTGIVTLSAASVTNEALAAVPTATIKGRATAGTGSPADLTTAQATALLDAMVGDAGSGGTKGLVPAPATGDAAKFLRGDATWGMPAGGGGGEANTASNVNAGGVGVFKQKTGVDLEFRGLNAGSNKVTVTSDAANNEIDIDIAEANLTLASLGGSIDLGGAKASGTLAAARFPALTGDVINIAGALAATIANDAVSNAKLADVATATIKGRATAGAGDPEDLTAAQVRALINVADAATANSPDATLLARANHTGSQAATTISDFAAAADARVSAGVATHEAAGDPHPQYLTAAEANAAFSALGHAHTLANVTDVSITAANLNALDDGADTTLHFHAADRARANHTGTQAAATISDFNAATDARVDAGIASHEGAGDPHPQYLTAAEGNAAYSALGHTHPGLAPAGGTAGQVLKKIDGTDHNYSWQVDATGGGGLIDGDYGDITVSGGGTAMAVDADTITNGKLANVATATIKGRVTAGAGDPEDLTAAQVRALINVADGATANSPDATLLARANHSGSQAASTISDFAAAADARVSAGIATHEAAGDPHPQYLTTAEGGAAYAPLGHGHSGLAPAGGATGQVLKKVDGTDYNFSWQADAGGGGGSGDVVGPASAIDNALPRYDSTTGKLLQGSDVLVTDANEVDLPAVASPTAPAADRLRIFGKKSGGRMLPAYMGPSGLDNLMQPFLGFTKVGYFNPAGNSAATPAVFGMISPTVVGTATARPIATTNMFTRARRLGWVSTATAGNPAAMQFSALQYTVSNGSGVGGFFLVARFGASDAATVAGARSFFGMRNVTTTPTNVEPSTLTNVIGIGNGAADSNMKMFYGGTTAQAPIDLGANFPANTLSIDMYELVLFAPPNALRTIHYQVTRLNTGHVATGTLSGTTVQVPSETTLLQAFCGWRNNNATALAVAIDIASLYIETDL